MKNLFDAALRGLLLAALVALGACGPGGGGTGTGPLSFSGLGRSVTTAQPGTSPPTGGTAGGCTDCVRVDVQLQEAQIELTTPCSRFVFEGPWAQDVNGVVTVTGRYETPALGRTVVATLRLQFSGGADSSQQVTATLLDEAGALQVGPVTLARQAMLEPRPAAPATCP
jgi:hypothetical protein